MRKYLKPALEIEAFDVEDVITARDLILAGETGCHVHLCHCSTAFSPNCSV